MKPLVCLLVSALVTATAVAQDANEIRIAVVAPISSRIGHVAQEALNGATLGANEGASRLASWSARPVEGVPNIKLDFFDDRGDARTAQDVAHAIASSGQYAAVVGGINSGTAIPSAHIYEQATLINLSLGATNPLLTRSGHRWALRMSMDDDQLARDTYRVSRDRFLGQPALFVHDGTFYGELTANGFSSAHRAFKGEVAHVKNLGIEGEGDLQIPPLNNGSAAVLYLGGMDKFAIKVIDRLPRYIHWTIVSGDGACSEPMAQETARLHMALVCASQERKASVPASGSAFEQAYKARFGQQPGQMAQAAFDAVALLVETFGKQGRSASSAVLGQLKSGGPVAGGEGPIAFDARGDNTLAPAYLYEADKGALMFKRRLR